MFCENCGKLIGDQEKFCAYCGARNFMTGQVPPRPVQQGYQQGFQTQPKPQQEKKQQASTGLAIASGILGIAGLLFSCVFFGCILGLVGIILGIIALVKKKSAKGMSIAGVICGGLSLIVAAIVLILSINIYQRVSTDVPETLWEIITGDIDLGDLDDGEDGNLTPDIDAVPDDTSESMEGTLDTLKENVDEILDTLEEEEDDAASAGTDTSDEEDSELWDEDEDSEHEMYIEPVDPDFILAESSHDTVGYRKLLALSDRDLRIAKNEIYARHGRLFDSKDLQVYFASRSWYYGYLTPDEFSEDLLSETEKENVARMVNIEEDRVPWKRAYNSSAVGSYRFSDGTRINEIVIGRYSDGRLCIQGESWTGGESSGHANGELCIIDSDAFYSPEENGTEMVITYAEDQLYVQVKGEPKNQDISFTGIYVRED